MEKCLGGNRACENQVDSSASGVGGGGCYVASSAAKEVHIVGAVGIIHETIDRCFYRFINKTLGVLGGDSSGWIEGFFG